MTAEEEKIREHVRELRSFYTNILIFAGVAILSILAWLFSGGGKFWPIWVVIGSGLAVGLQAFRLGMMPSLEEWFPFLTNAWEEQKVVTLLKNSNKAAATKMAPKKAK